MQNSIVTFYTDNMGVKYIVNNCTSKDDLIMKYLRKLILIIVKLNIDLRARHVEGLKNIACDRISRFQVTEQMLSQFGLKRNKTEVPSSLIPHNSSL